MRLIDADALKRKAQKFSTEAWKTNRVAKVTTILNQFIDWIDGMPTMPPRTVKLAKDIDKTVDAESYEIGYTHGQMADRPTGEWVGGQEYCKHLEEKTGERYAPTGLGKFIYCNQCWQANNRHSAYCPNCGAEMRVKENE